MSKKYAEKLRQDNPKPPVRAAEIYLLPLSLFIFFAVIIVRSGWLCEDSYITFRTVYNFVNGFGLRWNINERVQTFTNPLWTLGLSAAFYVTREMYFTALFTSVAVSLAAVALLISAAANRINMILIVLGLSLSKAFVDFSTSGLENPMTHLLLGGFFLVYFRLAQRENLADAPPAPLFWLSLFAALGVLNRMDIGVIFLPALAHVFWKSVIRRAIVPVRVSNLLAMIAGFLPFILWEGFSLIYYGFLFPNTAYAKLSSGVHPSERVEQGLYYLLNSLNWDPITLFIIFGVLLTTLLAFPKRRFQGFAALGVILYLVYVVRIGGDFMSGRFLTAPLFCAMILLAQMSLRPILQGVPVMVILVLLGMSEPTPTIENYDPHARLVDNRGISDGRSRDAEGSALARADRNTLLPKNERVIRARQLKRDGVPVTIEPAIGYFGYAAGPTVHVLDTIALGDPLLARLPTKLMRGEWMIAHFYRPIPDGYLEASIDLGKINDPSLQAYWEKLRFVTRGGLLDWARLKEIWNINTGKYDHWLDEYCLRNYAIDYAHEISSAREEGSDWNAPGNYRLNRHGLGIRFDSGQHGILRGFTASLNGGETYAFAYFAQGKEICRDTAAIPPAPTGGMVIYHGAFPAQAIQQQFDMLRILPANKPHKHSIGHLRVDSAPIAKTLTEISVPKAEGTAWDAPGNLFLNYQDLLITLDAVDHARRFEISADCNDDYEITFFLDQEKVGMKIVPQNITSEGGLSVSKKDVPEAAAARGYNRILIAPYRGDGRYSFGHFRLIE